MGFEDTSKGFFPHKFNVEENQNYVGPYPDASFYGPEEMKSDVKKKFEAWYETVKHLIFNFQLDMLLYCINDVDILRKACIKFTLEMMAEAGFSIFEQTTTLASAVNKIFCKNFYKPDSLAITPITYRLSDTQSKGALKFILYLEMKYKIKIQSAHDGREKVIMCPPNKQYKVDGYFVDSAGYKTVVEYNGCYYHSHTCLAPNSMAHLRKPKPKDDKKPADDNEPAAAVEPKKEDFDDLESEVALRRERTARKLRDLQANGYKVITMYECEFKKILKANPQLAKRLEEDLSTEPLLIRDSFFGGSVDATCTYFKVKDDEKIHYRDFTSLYPTVNMYDKMPTGPPKRIILGHEKCSKIDLMTFDGFIKARVLPPNNLFFGVLPSKVNDKLMFPLCYACGFEENQGACRHTDLQRSFVGTFVSIELKLAIEKGYKVDEVFELQEFELRDDLFVEYIKHFYVNKLQASGAPSGIDLDEFIEQYKQREGIQLDRNKFQKNPSKRTLAKLMLNT